ncbi:MAG: LuxR C-terminal-related transcriptional regulator, partial [Glaciimonas sp.]|nr:LuxR C-terminal-related transcriptional regulator [Glaciimonas sp.]
VHTPLQTQFLAQLLALTERQIDVLNLLVQGKPNKIICRELQIAEGTAKSHISAIMRALKVKNRTQVSAVINQFSNNIASDIRKNIQKNTQKIGDTNTIENDISPSLIPLHSEKTSAPQNSHR